jgi:hypothetical protein
VINGGRQLNGGKTGLVSMAFWGVKKTETPISFFIDGEAVSEDVFKMRMDQLPDHGFTILNPQAPQVRKKSKNMVVEVRTLTPQRVLTLPENTIPNKKEHGDAC